MNKSEKKLVEKGILVEIAKIIVEKVTFINDLQVICKDENKFYDYPFCVRISILNEIDRRKNELNWWKSQYNYYNGEIVLK